MLRAAHFLGQGAIESQNLNLIVEGSVSFNRHPEHPSFAEEINGHYADRQIFMVISTIMSVKVMIWGMSLKVI